MWRAIGAWIFIVLEFFVSPSINYQGYILKILYYWNIVKEILFPVRGNFVQRNRHNSIVLYKDRNGLHRKLVLPPMGPALTWDKCEARIIVEKDLKPEEFSDTDDENTANDNANDSADDLDGEFAVNTSPKPIIESEYVSIDVTAHVIEMAGPERDFYRVGLTPAMLHPEWESLKFINTKIDKHVIIEKHSVIELTALFLA